MSAETVAAEETGGMVILGGGAQQLALIELARNRGLHTTVLEPDPEAPGRAIADHFVVVDLADWDRCHAAVKLARPQGIATFAADFPIPMLARLCAAFDLPGVSQETARAATDKAVMRAAFDKHGVPRPNWLAACDVATTLSARRQLGGHVIIKPARSSGSRGVYEVGTNDTDESIRNAVLEVLGIGDVVLVEEVADGPEVSVESVTINGHTTVLAVTDKITTGAPEFVEVGHSQPSAFAESNLDAIHVAAIAAIDSIGLTNGIGHTEIRVGRAGPSVIEVAARAGGGYIMSHLLPLTTGVNALSLTLDLALGCASAPVPDQRGGAGVRFLEAPAGQVLNIHGRLEASLQTGITDVIVDLTPGVEVRPLRDARDRIGQVIATGADAATAYRRAVDAAATIRIDVSDSGMAS